MIAGIDIATKVTDLYLKEKAYQESLNPTTRAPKRRRPNGNAEQSRWDSWGKCAAGIVGGAILGGIAGVAAAC